MESTKQFVIWLDGFLDACGNSLNEPQTETIKNKLNNLFQHETEQPKTTLEELGNKYGFEVKTNISTEQFNKNDGNEVIYRC